MKLTPVSYSPGSQSFSMVVPGCHDRHFVLSDGVKCHIRVFQLSNRRYGLYACPNAVRLLKDPACPTSSIQQLSNIQSVLDHVQDAILQAAKRNINSLNGCQALLSQFNEVGWSNVLRFTGDNVVMRGPDNEEICISITELNDRSLAAVYTERLELSAASLASKTMLEELDQNFITHQTKYLERMILFGPGDVRRVQFKAGLFIIEADGKEPLMLRNATDLSNIPPVKDRSAYECPICMSWGSLTDFACSSCKKSFHTECLKEWLRECPDTKLGFGLLSGPCALCDSTISICE